MNYIKKYDFKIEYKLPPYIFRMRTPKIFEYLSNIDLSSFDLVHSLFDFPYCVMAARLANKYNKNLIIGAQGTYGVLPLTYWPEKYFLNWSYKKAKLIIVPSVFTKEKIQEVSGKYYNFKVIHNGVNFNRFQKSVDTSDIKEKTEGKRMLLTVGGLKGRKGQDIVIKALGILRKKRSDFCYMLVGDGSWKEYLENLTKKEGLEGKVFFEGEKRGEDLIKYFKAADIYIHTPRFKNLNFEGFGIVYLEASACGKPIIAADSGGVKDAVLDKKTGIIVPEENIGMTEEAIEKLFNNNNLARELGRNGENYAKIHDWSIIANKFVEVYKNI